MAGEYQFGGTTVTIGSDAVAKVTSLRYSMNMQEVEVTGAEDVTGALVDEQFIPVSIGRTLDLEGIAIANTGLTGVDIYETAQEALRDAAEAGTEVTLDCRYPITPSGGVVKGRDYTGYFTAFQEQGGVKDVYKWSGTFRINSVSEVLS